MAADGGYLNIEFSGPETDLKALSEQVRTRQAEIKGNYDDEWDFLGSYKKRKFEFEQEYATIDGLDERLDAVLSFLKSIVSSIPNLDFYGSMSHGWLICEGPDTDITFAHIAQSKTLQWHIKTKFKRKTKKEAWEWNSETDETNVFQTESSFFSKVQSRVLWERCSKKESTAKECSQSDVLTATEAKKYWRYEKMEDGGLRILGYKGTSLEVVVPREIGKNPVLEIGESAFSPDAVRLTQDARQTRAKLYSITLPDGLLCIGKRAFYNCKGLRRIAIPGSVSSIQEAAFMFCTMLTEITISDGVTSIGDFAFLFCSLRDITIPQSVTSIGRGAFDGHCTLNKTLNTSKEGRT